MTAQSTFPEAPILRRAPSPSDRFFAPVLRARFVVGLLCVTMVLDVIGICIDGAIISTAHALIAGQDVQNALDLLQLGNALLALAGFVVYIATAVLFCCWLYRVVKNSHILSTDSGPSPGLAAGSFFIPFYNLWGPFLAVKFAWNASSRLAYLEESGRPALTIPGLWWVTWIIGNIIGRIILQQVVSSWGQQPTPDQLARESTINIAMAATNLVCAALCVATVLKLTGMQRTIERDMREAALHAEHEAA